MLFQITSTLISCNFTVLNLFCTLCLFLSVLIFNFNFWFIQLTYFLQIWTNFYCFPYPVNLILFFCFWFWLICSYGWLMGFRDLNNNTLAYLESEHLIYPLGFTIIVIARVITAWKIDYWYLFIYLIMSCLDKQLNWALIPLTLAGSMKHGHL